MFDEKTEELAKELGMEVWFPPAKLRQRCDNKMETVRIGNKAGVYSVPNALEKVDSYEHLRQICERAKLGHDLVIQTAFGDSGHTTFFIANEDDFNKHKDEIVNDPEVKIMKRINCRGATLEACATQSGTLVGPLLTEVVGAKELTPYKGGWCGNEVFPGAFSEGVRAKAREMAEKFGNQLLRGRLPRLLRPRLPDRPGLGRGLPRRAEPAHLRREPDDQPRRVRVRRRAAVPLSPARVQRRAVRPQRQGDQRTLGAAALHRLVVAGRR